MPTEERTHLIPYKMCGICQNPLAVWEPIGYPMPNSVEAY